MTYSGVDSFINPDSNSQPSSLQVLLENKQYHMISKLNDTVILSAAKNRTIKELKAALQNVSEKFNLLQGLQQWYSDWNWRRRSGACSIGNIIVAVQEKCMDLQKK